MSAQLDEISPLYLGEDRIDLAVAVGSELRAYRSVVLTVDYERAEPEGVMLPLEMIVQGPSQGSYQRRVFSRLAPGALAFMAREGGSHLIILREVAHNRWFGRLVVSLTGPLLDPPHPL